MHFIKVAQQTGDVDKALTQICIGSDFDGIINSVWCCPAASGLNDFKREFLKTFMSFAHSNRDVVALPSNFDVEKFADQLFFKNGKNFILERLKKINA